MRDDGDLEAREKAKERERGSSGLRQAVGC